MKRLKIMFVVGTRPEAIKLAPLILEARKDNGRIETCVVVTAQHREMLDVVLRAFEISPDVDLNIMAQGQSLYYVTARIFQEMEAVIRDRDPDIIVVQGDTTTVFAVAVSGFYARKKIAHVEAGLRTGDKFAPFPEEMNRRIASCAADFHFAPTESARRNLLREGIAEETIHVTGNTVIDALLWMAKKVEGQPCPVPDFAPFLENGRRMVLITGHRRENFGEPFRRITSALRTLAERNPAVAFVYPVHLNPNVQHPVREVLGGLANFHLLPPLAYPDFVWFMQRSHFIITDSGGVQEEAPALGKPVLVTRRVTERPEAVEEGLVRLVGDDGSLIVESTQRLLDDTLAWKAMARGVSPYGDGGASPRILAALRRAQAEGLSTRDTCSEERHSP